MVMWLVGTATVTTQGPQRALRHDKTKSGDFYLAKTGDSDLATSEDFFMAMNKGVVPLLHGIDFGSAPQPFGPVRFRVKDGR